MSSLIVQTPKHYNIDYFQCPSTYYGQEVEYCYLRGCADCGSIGCATRKNNDARWLDIPPTVSGATCGNWHTIYPGDMFYILDRDGTYCGYNQKCEDPEIIVYFYKSDTTTTTTTTTLPTTTTTLPPTTTTIPTCTPKWLDEYRCEGDYLQRNYQYGDCSKEWKPYEYCDYGCENAPTPHCEEAPSCTIGAKCKDDVCSEIGKYCQGNQVFRTMSCKTYVYDTTCVCVVGQPYEKQEYVKTCDYGCENGACLGPTTTTTTTLAPTYTCYSNADCQWCGTTCEYKQKIINENLYCPAVVPPAGYECKCVNGVCQMQVKPPEPEGFLAKLWAWILNFFRSLFG